jgi:hypothetical protein
VNITFGVYLGLLTMVGTGSFLTWNEWNYRRLMNARRWRMKIKKLSLKEYPPFIWITSVMEKNKKDKMDIEIYESISFLRNLTAIGKGRSVSADMMIEQLADYRGLLSPIYSRMLVLLRQNQKEEAIRYFSETVGTEISKDFARLLIQWDEIDPKELMETLLSHQKNIKEVRLTLQKRRDEIVSDLIYLPVVINVMLVFINFIYVGYFINQKEILTMFL